MNRVVENLVWRALADPIRRDILDALRAGALTTGELVERFSGLCRTAVMKHLDVLVAADLVTVRREGRCRWNAVNPVLLERVCQRWVQPHLTPLTLALGRLKDIVEADLLPPAAPGRSGTCEVSRHQR